MVESLLNKVVGLYQKETSTQVISCENSEIFKNTFFDRTPPVAAFINASLKTFHKCFLLFQNDLETRILLSALSRYFNSVQCGKAPEKKFVLI